MRAPLDIPTARHYWKRIIWMFVGVSPFVALAIAQAAHDFPRPERRDMAFAMLGIGAFMLLAPAIFLLVRRRWVARMDERGATLRNGRCFAWSGFVRVEPVKNHRLRIINHYDLVFRDGRAGVFFRMAANEDEVCVVVAALERGDNPWVPPP